MTRRKWLNGNFWLGANIATLIMNISTPAPWWGLAGSAVGIYFAQLMIREGR